MPELTQNFDQQRKLFDPALARPVTVIGAGSVGSQVTVMLAQVGCTDITVFDGDDIASHNIPQSAYRIADLAHWKTEALHDIVLQKAGVEINGIRRMWNGERLRGAVLCCVDDMDTRIRIWERVRQNPLVDIFVDTRIDQEFVAVYAIIPTNREHIKIYESRLYPSRDAKIPTCGEHGIIYVSALAALAAASRLTNHWKGGINPPRFEMLAGCLQQIT